MFNQIKDGDLPKSGIAPLGITCNQVNPIIGLAVQDKVTCNLILLNTMSLVIDITYIY